MNEEFLVNASHQLALITSLPFVHTARRYYRLNGLVRDWDWRRPRSATIALDCRKLFQTWSFRGSKSRNKVSVGEPAEGSLPLSHSLRQVLKTTVNCLDRAGWRLRLKWVSVSRTRPRTCSYILHFKPQWKVQLIFATRVENLTLWQLLTVNLLVLASMTNVASCDK